MIIGLVVVCDVAEQQRANYVVHVIQRHAARLRLPFAPTDDVLGHAHLLAHRFNALARGFRPLFHKLLMAHDVLRAELIQALQDQRHPHATHHGHARTAPHDVLIHYFDRLGLPLEERGAQALLVTNFHVFEAWRAAVEDAKRAEVNRARQRMLCLTQGAVPLTSGASRRQPPVLNHANSVSFREEVEIIGPQSATEPVNFGPVDWEEPLVVDNSPPPPPPTRRKIFQF